MLTQMVWNIGILPEQYLLDCNLDTGRRKLAWIKVWDSSSSPYVIARWYFNFCMNQNFCQIMLDLTREQRQEY